MTRRPGFPARLPATPSPAPLRRAPVAAATIAPGAPAGIGLDSHAVRTRMVQKLAALGVRDARVLAAMNAVERHRFVDSALVNQAYEDSSLPKGTKNYMTPWGYRRRLDHMFFRLPQDWSAEYRRLDSRYGSDHYPLVARVRFDGARR